MLKRSDTFHVLVVACVCAVGASADVFIETVAVGNASNAGELSGQGAGGQGPDRVCGAVSYVYRIGKYEVTAGQYVQFLNSVAASDTYGLYDTAMADPLDALGCNIQRSGVPGAYTYSVPPDWAGRPVNYISFWDACRFANWLHNGRPSGPQGTSTTETGAYTLNGYTGDDGREIQRNPGWRWAVTSEDEWYKAAYHKNNGVTGNYWDYPTRSDNEPTNDVADPDPGGNANFWIWPADWALGSPYWRTVVGEFENSASPYGTFDQGGNVWEWNESIVFEGEGWSRRGQRSGSWGSAGHHLRAASRVDAGPAYQPESKTGFRVSERSPCLDDMNCDGRVDFSDIDPFVRALGGPDYYYALYPDCWWLNGDCDGDGHVTFRDIDCFVAQLGSGC